jgi:hypothetical protein
MRLIIKSDEKQIKTELIVFYGGLVLGLSLILVGGIFFNSNLGSGIFIGVGASILASEFIFLIQKILMSTPQQAVNEFKLDLHRAFHGLIISDLELIYEESLFWLKYSLEKGYDIYELSTSPNCEYYEKEVRNILDQYSKKYSDTKNSCYHRYFDCSIDKQRKLETIILKIDKKYCTEESIDNVLQDLDGFLKEEWLTITTDKEIPTDAILIVNDGVPIYTMVELYDYCMKNGERSVLSFSSNHPEFLSHIHNQIKAIH